MAIVMSSSVMSCSGDVDVLVAKADAYCRTVCALNPQQSAARFAVLYNRVFHPSALLWVSTGSNMCSLCIQSCCSSLSCDSLLRWVMSDKAAIPRFLLLEETAVVVAAGVWF